ncbi:actin-depolymerizing factor homology domain-containing protein [Aspergillus insuetus]
MPLAETELLKYQELKLGRSYQYIIFNIDTSVKSAKLIKVEKLSPDGNYDDFLADLPETECQFAVVDFSSTARTESRNKIVFVNCARDI